MSYKEGGDTEKIYQLNQKKLKTIKDSKADNFKQIHEIKSKYYYHKFQTNKFGAISLFILGSVTFSTGLALFIQDKSGGTNSPTAQYTLMLGGLSIINSGIALNLRAESFLKRSSSYGSLLKNNSCEGLASHQDCYVFSGEEVKNKKKMVGAYLKHGGAMLLVSIPMFVVTVFSFIDTRKYHDENNPRDIESWDPDISELGLYVAFFCQALAFAPAIASFVAGVRMLSKSSKYKELNTEHSLLTLNSIAPIIDPVSKTYGLSMGFSF